MISHYFISINIPKEIARKIKNKIKDKFKDIFVGTKVSIDKYHLTLRFFGEINEDEISEIRKRLRRVDFRSFYVSVGELGYFKNRFRGILYVKLNSDKLNQLVENIWEEVGSEKRKFASHITLVRTKKCLHWESLEKLMKDIKFENLGFEVNKFSLMKSELKKTGAEYTILEDFGLK